MTLIMLHYSLKKKNSLIDTDADTTEILSQSLGKKGEDFLISNTYILIDSTCIILFYDVYKTDVYRKSHQFSAKAKHLGEVK